MYYYCCYDNIKDEMCMACSMLEGNEKCALNFCQ